MFFFVKKLLITRNRQYRTTIRHSCNTKGSNLALPYLFLYIFTLITAQLSGPSTAFGNFKINYWRKNICLGLPLMKKGKCVLKPFFLRNNIFNSSKYIFILYFAFQFCRTTVHFGKQHITLHPYKFIQS